MVNTKKNKGKRHKKTFKRYKKGGSSPTIQEKGTLTIMGDKLSGLLSSATKSLTDTGLKMAGLERIRPSLENTSVPTSKLIETTDASNNSVIQTADKMGATLLENINEVLDSNTVKENTQQAAQDTADIIKHEAEIFNKALDNPEVKQEVVKAIDNAGDIAEVVVKASEKPVNEIIDATAQNIPKVMDTTSRSAVRIVKDMAEEIPLIGSFVALGDIANNLSKSAKDITAAGTDVIETASNSVVDANQNIKKGLAQLSQQQKISNQVAGRIRKSIYQFENNIYTEKRKYKNNKAKSKKVRFAI